MASRGRVAVRERRMRHSRQSTGGRSPDEAPTVEYHERSPDKALVVEMRTTGRAPDEATVVATGRSPDEATVVVGAP